MLDSLYSDALLTAAASLPARGPLPDVPARARRASRVCGSAVELALIFDGDTIADVAIDARACALGQAAAGLFLGAVPGARPEEIRAARNVVAAMLKAGGPPPTSGRWASLSALAPIAAYPARHASTLLVFDAAVAALDAVGR